MSGSRTEPQRKIESRSRRLSVSYRFLVVGRGHLAPVSANLSGLDIKSPVERSRVRGSNRPTGLFPDPEPRPFLYRGKVRLTLGIPREGKRL